MFLRMSSFGIGAHLVLAAGAMVGLSAPAAASGPDVSVSIRVGSNPQLDYSVISRDCDEAGVLTIDGRRFAIDTHSSVREQIHRAFECMGYDAWCVGRSVRVRTDHCGPEVCWKNGEYAMEFRERHHSITVTPVAECHDHDHGRHYRYGYDRGHGRYFTYNEVQGAHGGVSWTSIGLSTFVDNDRDLDEELHDARRSDDAEGARKRYEPDQRRNQRSDETRRVVENRSSIPQKPVQKRGDDTARRSVQVEPKATELKRTSAPVARKDEVKVLPSDRVGNLKRSQDATPRQEVKVTPSTKKDDSKAKQSTTSLLKRKSPTKAASRTGADQREKW